MGKVFIEKMLRITEVEKLYLLMRPKKGKNPKDRLVDIFANPVSFDQGGNNLLEKNSNRVWWKFS